MFLVKNKLNSKIEIFLAKGAGIKLKSDKVALLSVLKSACFCTLTIASQAP